MFSVAIKNLSEAMTNDSRYYKTTAALRKEGRCKSNFSLFIFLIPEILILIPVNQSTTAFLKKKD